jgi:hypothetical protein
MENPFEVTRAKRQAVPMLISTSGTSGSGKTFSSLLLAGGIAGDSGTVGMLDAENGRGTLYEDDPDIRKAIPRGYLYTAITPPYSPARYVQGLRAMEQAGVTVALIDSTSHEWEGEGGCADIAENNKLKGMPNWMLAKKEHKKFLAYCLSSPMHIIFCLRARDNTTVVKEGGKEQFVHMGIQPICEKNFVFEQLLSLSFDESTHHYCGIKVPKMLRQMFPGGELITKAHGAAIAEWASGGTALAPDELLQKRASYAAQLGLAEYGSFFASLTAAQRKTLIDTTHSANKAVAGEVDRLAQEADKGSEPAE